MINKVIPTISLILDFLHKYPNGGTRDEIYYYCLSNGATFDVINTDKQKKSVSGELSKLAHLYGLAEYQIIYGQYIWKLKKKG